MKLRRNTSVKINAIMNAILTMSTFIFAIVTFPYASRVILPEGTGKVSFAKSVISYFTMFAQLGIPTYGIRECAKARDNQKKLSTLVHELITLNAITCSISYLVFLALLVCVPKFSSEKALFVTTSLSILLNFIGMEWLYQALELYTYITVRSVTFKAIALILMFALVRSKTDYIAYGAILVFGTYAANIINFLNIPKLIHIDWHEQINIKQHVKFILIFFAMTCATIVYTNLDNVMLGFMKTDIDVGYYDAAIKVKSILVSIVTSLGVVLLPRSSYYFEQGRKSEFISLTRKAMNFVILAAFPMTLYFLVYAKESIFFLSGSAYAGSIIPMKIIIPTVIFIGMSNITGMQILVPLGKEKIVLYSEIIGAVVDFIINLIAIPQFGASGAAFGTLIAELIVWLFQYTYIFRSVDKIYDSISWVKIIPSLIIPAIIVICLGKNIHGVLLKLLITAIVYFGFYFILLLILKEPLTMQISNQLVYKIKRRKG